MPEVSVIFSEPLVSRRLAIDPAHSLRPASMKPLLRFQTIFPVAFGLMAITLAPGTTLAEDTSLRQVLADVLKRAIPSRPISLTHAEQGEVLFKGTIQPVDPSKRFTTSVDRLSLSRDRLDSTTTIKGPIRIAGEVHGDGIFSQFESLVDFEATLSLHGSLAAKGLILTITPVADRLDGKVTVRQITPAVVKDSEGLATEKVNEWIAKERDRELLRLINEKLIPIQLNILKALGLKSDKSSVQVETGQATENPELAKVLQGVLTSWLSEFNQSRPWTNHDESTRSIVARTPEIRQKIPAVEQVIPEVKVLGKVITRSRRIVITPAREIVIPAQEKKIGEHVHALDGKTWIADPSRIVVEVLEIASGEDGLSVALQARGPVHTEQRYDIRSLVSARLKADGEVTLEARAILRWNQDVARPETVVMDLNGRVRNLKLSGMGPILAATRTVGNLVTGDEIDQVVERGINNWFPENRDRLREQLGRDFTEKLGQLSR